MIRDPIAPAEYGVCDHGTPLRMTCGPCDRILPGANEAAAMSPLTTGGWTCAQCQAFVGVNQSHTCRTVPTSDPPFLTVFSSTKPVRYRITGSLTDRGVGGRRYEVDLVVEAIP